MPVPDAPPSFLASLGQPTQSRLALAFALACLAYVVVDELRRVSRRALAWLAVSLVAGTLLRVWFAPATLMEMSTYLRQPVFFDWLPQLGVPLHRLFPEGSDRWQEILALDMVLSCLLPGVVFVHAQVCFRNERVSAWAALLMAVCPLPIYLAHSDVQFISSCLLASLTFTLLYRGLTAERVVTEILFGSAAIVLLGATLHARQDNFLFGGLALGTSAFAIATHPRRPWLHAAWGVLFCAVSLTVFGQQVQSQVALAGLSGVPSYVLSHANSDVLHALLSDNNYLLPWLFPLWYVVLIIIGARWTWRSERRVFAYLAWWFLVFYGGHAFVNAYDPTAAARYAMHSIVPLTFAAAYGAASLPESVRRWSVGRLAALAGGVLVTTVWGLGLFRQGESDVQEEYRFLRELSDRGLPESGSVVIESYGNDIPASGWLDAPDLRAGRATPRFEYFGPRVRNGELVDDITTSSVLEVGDRPVYLYLGLPCLWLRHRVEPPGSCWIESLGSLFGRDGSSSRYPQQVNHCLDAREPISRSCASALASGDWQPVAEHTVTGRIHDRTNGVDATGLKIGLYRLVW